ncbi:hypothetical protein MRX96_012330 [Rhipicephalus microplus]
MFGKFSTVSPCADRKPRPQTSTTHSRHGVPQARPVALVIIGSLPRVTNRITESVAHHSEKRINFQPRLFPVPDETKIKKRGAKEKERSSYRARFESRALLRIRLTVHHRSQHARFTASCFKRASANRDAPKFNKYPARRIPTSPWSARRNSSGYGLLR